MDFISKNRGQYLVTLLWCVYALYLILFENLLFFPNDSLELFVPAILQTVITIMFNRLFRGNYISTINLTALICCLLVIIWHFNINHGISRKVVIILFAVMPIILTTVTYLYRKIKKNFPITYIKNLGVSWLLTLLNIIIAIFVFYTFHYQI